MKIIKEDFCILLSVLGSCGAEIINSSYQVTVPKLTKYLLEMILTPVDSKVNV